MTIELCQDTHLLVDCVLVLDYGSPQNVMTEFMALLEFSAGAHVRITQTHFELPTTLFSFEYKPGGASLMENVEPRR